jgi:hypothetical protein
MSDKRQTQTQRPKPKGGTRFPQQALGELVEYVDSLARKTRQHDISLAQLNVSVFGLSEGSKSGKVQFSSMKQFGLVEGKYEALRASPLAQAIAGSQGDGGVRFLRTAFANVKTFADTFRTFAGDETEIAKIESYAEAPLGVHPDKASLFARNFAKSAEACGLATVAADRVTLEQSLDLSVGEQATPGGETQDDLADDALDDRSGLTMATSPGSGHSIAIQVDSSMDPEKLEKHLRILRRYGLI